MDTLEAQKRTILGKKVKKLRKTGKIPVVLYGHGIETQPLTVDQLAFQQLFKKAGISALVNLKVDKGAPFKVLLREPEREPIKNSIIHADIYKVKMSEKIKTEIPLEFVGESPAVTELEGNLIINKDAIEVECLPDALVQQIDVDLAQIKTFDNMIQVKDIKVPEKMEVLDDPEDVVATVAAPRTEEELAEELAETGEEEEKEKVASLAETPEETEEKTK